MDRISLKADGVLVRECDIDLQTAGQRAGADTIGRAIVAAHVEGFKFDGLAR